MRRFLLMAMVWLMLTGCSLVGDYTLARRSKIDAQIAAARVETTTHLNALNDQQLALLKQSILAHEGREQGAADLLFKGVATFNTLKAPLSRVDMVMGQSIQLTAAVLPPASPAAQAKAFQDLKTELDEAKVSTEALRAQYEGELGKARAEGAAKDKALADIAVKLKTVDEERVTVLAKANATEAALSDKRKELDNKTIADKTRDAEEAKHNEALKRWLMAGLGIIALAAGAAAVYLPIPSVKPKLTIIAIAAAILAFCVPFIQWYHVAIAIAVICIPVGLAILHDYRVEHGDATDTYRGLNELKARAKETFTKELAPILDQWHTPDATKRIDDRLKAVGDT